METITGTIAAISDKGNKYGMKIGDDWYNGFGSPKFSKGQEVTISYIENDPGNGRVFKNIEKIELVKAGNNPPPQSPDKSDSGEFKPASDLSPMDKTMGYVAQVMGLCDVEAGKILGHKPQSDGERAMVNSMFIEMNKRSNVLAIGNLAKKIK